MKTIEISEATGPLDRYARDLGREPLVLTDGGQPIAALLPIEDVDLESVALGSNPKFLALIERARAERRGGLGLTPDQVRDALGLTGAADAD